MWRAVCQGVKSLEQVSPRLGTGPAQFAAGNSFIFRPLTLRIRPVFMPLFGYLNIIIAMVCTKAKGYSNNSVNDSFEVFAI